ncbi:MAG: ribonuclease D [Alphaproteobacteria bacterium]|nr:ribonuclease D [Alphaproteobacteria bacterium]
MTLYLHQGDLPASVSFGASVAVDTESMGLNFRRDRLCVVQLSGGDGHAHLVQLPKNNIHAPNLARLMADAAVLKIFHFARADMVPIKHYIGAMPAPVYCTKIASVLSRTFSDRHSLKNLLKELLAVDVSKEQQTSDWGQEKLTPEQQTYAAGDVLYLHRLRDRLDDMLAREGKAALARRIMDFLPTRAEMDVAGYENVEIFSYNPFPDKT